MFVCLDFSSQSRIFHSYGDVTITGKRQQIAWPLSIEGSLACYTFFDLGNPFIWSSPRTRDTHICCRAFPWGSGAVTTCFNYLRLLQPWFEHPVFCMRGKRATQKLWNIDASVKYDCTWILKLDFKKSVGIFMENIMKYFTRTFHIKTWFRFF